MSIQFGSKKSNTNTTSATNPWAPTIPSLNDFLSKLNTSSANVGTVTPKQADAFGTLEGNAGQYGSYAPAIGALATDTFNTGSKSGDVAGAYSTLRDQLTPYASGQMLDLGNNPYIQNLLNTVRSDVSNKTNSEWGAGGREFSPGHAMAMSRGITSAEAPILLNQYNTEANRQVGAANNLYSGGVNAASTGQGLDAQALQTRAGGIPIAQAQQDATDRGPNAVLNLEEQMKGLPFQDLGWIAQYLFPAAQLGQQSTGTSQTKSSQWQAGVDAKSAGQGIGALGTLLP